MNKNLVPLTAALLVTALWLAAAPVPNPDPAHRHRRQGFTKLKKDGVLMFCKRYRPIGSTIPQIQCITEPQLRVQFEEMTKYRSDMRQRTGKCDIHAGCQAGS